MSCARPANCQHGPSAQVSQTCGLLDPLPRPPRCCGTSTRPCPAAWAAACSSCPWALWTGGPSPCCWPRWALWPCTPCCHTRSCASSSTSSPCLTSWPPGAAPPCECLWERCLPGLVHTGLLVPKGDDFPGAPVYLTGCPCQGRAPGRLHSSGCWAKARTGSAMCQPMAPLGWPLSSVNRTHISGHYAHTVLTMQGRVTRVWTLRR